MVREIAGLPTKTQKYVLKMWWKRTACAAMAWVQPPRLLRLPSVTIVIANANGRESLELTLESIRKYTNYQNYRIVVADNASTDGSFEYLQSMTQMLPLEIIRNDPPKTHAQCLDWAFHNVDTEYWVGMDNDIHVLGKNWLADMVHVMEESRDMYLVGGERVIPIARYVEPVGNTTIRLAERFSAWLFCIRTSLRDKVDTSFAFYADHSDTDDLPLCYDTGARLLFDMAEKGVHFTYMPRWFRLKWHHIGGLTWTPRFSSDPQTRALKRFQAEDIRRRIRDRRI